ncbi:glycosyltransferase family 2 protein [Paucibacter sp. B2R-40]|nr:glycosyltransferase family 2 protein [Paucibacter sp. B2R-40]
MTETEHSTIPNGVTFSVVSHGQKKFIETLLGEISGLINIDFEVILTINIEEATTLDLSNFNFPIILIKNEIPKGFGENHNSAFLISKFSNFIVINPDILLPNKFLFSALDKYKFRSDVGIWGPRVVTPDGQLEDSVRLYPSFKRILKRVLLNARFGDYPPVDGTIECDWVAGMFMVFTRAAFKKVKGFDQNYFMYLEDADICRRLHAENYRVVYDSSFEVVHYAQRASRKNIRHVVWHLSSLFHFLVMSKFKEPKSKISD